MKVLLAIDGSDCSLAAVKEVAVRHWPQGTVIKVLAAVTTWFPSTPDPLLIGHVEQALTDLACFYEVDFTQ